MARVLVIDDEKLLRFSFKEFLKEAGYEVSTASSYDEAVDILGKSDFDVIFTDIILGGRTGIDVLNEARRMGVACPIVVITGFPDVDTASEAVRLGAFDYIRKPLDQNTLLKTAAVAVKYYEAEKNKEHYRENLEAIFNGIKEGILFVDEELRVMEANSSAVDICGMMKQFAGKPFQGLPGFCKVSCLIALEMTLGEEPVNSMRIECRRSDRPGQTVSISGTPLYDGRGGLKGAVMVISDDTRLVELEHDVEGRKELKRIVGDSKGMRDVRLMIEKMAEIDSTVLITGESGTGKDLLAEALYLLSERKKTGPYVVVNCAAIPENLIESELFGHEKGAFTGAVKRQEGKFEIAGKGVIFLDEIGDMSLPLQSKLLRVLQNREFHRVGGKEKITTEARVIAATNKNLSKLVKTGAFREDLFYRLKVVEIELPPLRDRKTDIPALVANFIDLFNLKFKKEIPGVSTDVMKIFMDYDWPGNVRELEHAVEHACILCPGGTITVEHLPKELKMTQLPVIIADDELSRIMAALERTRWNKGKAAQLLGMDRSTLFRKMKKYKLDEK